MSIALFFKQLLGAKLKTPLYTLSYEESHYEITQESEMVVMVQYWDEEENKVKVPYVSSTFLGHSTAADPMDNLIKSSNTLILRNGIKFPWIVQL